MLVGRQSFIFKFKKLVKEEIARIKVLTSDCLLQVVNQRPEGAGYSNNSEDKVKGVGTKKKELLQYAGARTIANLVAQV